MKRKLLPFMLAFIMVLALLPAAALAADDNLDGYNDNDFDKLQAFLDLPSAVAGQTNGQVLNPAYDPTDPATWTGVTWNADAEKRVVGISWGSCVSLAGALDVSGCTALESLDCYQNELASLDASGCAALGSLECYQNELAKLDVSDCAVLVGLVCFENQLTSLDVSDCTALTLLACFDNQLASLDVSGCAALQMLTCYGNRLTALDVSGCTMLMILFCGDNLLTSLDVSDSSFLMIIDTMNNLSSGEKNGNPLTQLHFIVGGIDYALNAAGGGYVNFDMIVVAFVATPLAPSTFVNWTDAGSNEVSATAEFLPSGPGAYTANFTPALELSPAGGSIYTGESVTITPNYPGGTWDFDTTLLSRSGNEFTALSEGTAQVTYTVGAQSAHSDIIITQTLELTSSITNGRIYTGGRITITPNIAGGTWDYPEDLLSAEASGNGMRFTGLAAGTARVTYTVGSQSSYMDIVITASELPSTGQDFTLIAALLALAACAGAAAVALLIMRSKRKAYVSR